MEGKDIIAAWLADRGGSVRQAARIIGVTHSTLNNLLAGTPPSNETLVLLRATEGLEGLLPEHFPRPQGEGYLTAIEGLREKGGAA